MNALEQLQGEQHWVCYTPQKMPIDPKNGKFAKAGQPETWGTYEQAVSYRKQHHDFVAGVGRELGFDEGLVFIDLDKCRNPRTGSVTPLAARVLNSIHSYAEVSPSGKGIHILAYGDIPGSLGPDKDATSENRVEMYKERRYFTWTGKQVKGVSNSIQNAFLSIYRLYWEIKDVRTQRYAQMTRERQDVLAKLGVHDAVDAEIMWASVDNYVRSALDTKCHEVASCKQGARYVTLRDGAFSMGQYVKYGLLAQSIAERDLSIAGIACGLTPYEIKVAIRDGIAAGIASNPYKPSFLRIVEEAKQLQAV